MLVWSMDPGLSIGYGFISVTGEIPINWSGLGIGMFLIFSYFCKFIFLII